MKKFDLNIEKVLENWEIYHAIREVIANAIDEQILTLSNDIQIIKDEKNIWHIRDFGRGLKYEHLTQNENIEKLEHPHLIGKFGVGLKDALATFHRRNVGVLIRSKYGDITLGTSLKTNFNDITTLHAYIDSPSNPTIKGTEFLLSNINDSEIEKAKLLFLLFLEENIIEETKYGSVLQKSDDNANIYINGVKVATESNFLFSYNITSLTKPIKDALNRERNNVGRSAYSDRVKSILLECKEKIVVEELVDDLEAFVRGSSHDELNWTDVSVHATKLLNSFDNVIFLTPKELIDAKEFVDRSKDDGYRVVAVSEKIKEKVYGETDYTGESIIELGEYIDQWSDSFKFRFVEIKDLSFREREIYNLTNEIFSLIGGKPSIIRKIKISESMRPNINSFTETAGLWNGSEIIIKRSQLQSLEIYAGTLLHETAHAISGKSDISSEFEEELTKLLGKIASFYLTHPKSKGLLEKLF